jgi:hypothetical protein
MPTLLLILCLGLNGSNSCLGRSNKNTPHASSQDQAVFLSTLLEQVDSSDEPALRIFLRLRIATYLWSRPVTSIEPESVATAALADLRAHEKQVPTLYVDQFRRNFIALLKLHAPNSAAAIAEDQKLDRRTELDVAYSLLGRENGTDQAVKMVQSSIAGGKDPGAIIVSFLHRLETIKPSDVSKLLNAVLVEEETRPGSISTGTLFGLKHLFIRQQTAQDLQRRYIIAVVNRAGEKDARLSSVVDTYTILGDLLPEVEKQMPDLYYPASAALSQLAGRVPSGTLERISIERRVRQSNDPLAQLMAEKEAVTDPSLKDDLQVEAAQLALEKGQIETAITLVVKLQPKNDETRSWRDQFIQQAAVKALDKGDLAVAEYGSRQISAAVVRSTVLQKIALYFQGSNNLSRARDTLISALKSVQTLDDSVDKTVALLDLANAFLKVDNQQALEIAQTAIKIINKNPSTQRSVETGSILQLSNAEKMLKIAYKLVPTFQALGSIDESAASNLAKDIQRQELRIAATFGAHTRQPAARNAQAVASQ